MRLFEEFILSNNHRAFRRRSDKVEVNEIALPPSISRFFSDVLLILSIRSGAAMLITTQPLLGRIL